MVDKDCKYKDMPQKKAMLVALEDGANIQISHSIQPSNQIYIFCSICHAFKRDTFYDKDLLYVKQGIWLILYIARNITSNSVFIVAIL